MPYKAIKRLLDILISTLLIILLLPLLSLISLAIFIQDRGLVFVTNPMRIGQKGRKFFMYKFRTMIPNAHEEIIENPKYIQLKEKWQQNGNKLKIEEDTRITPLGKLLRKTDIDELPQLINVLIGNMSLVGPRPMYLFEIKNNLEKYPKDKEYIKQIFTVKPGITGIWQVSGRNKISIHKKIQMEAKYAKSTSFHEDIKILFKTPYIVLTRKGAYE